MRTTTSMRGTEVELAPVERPVRALEVEALRPPRHGWLRRSLRAPRTTPIGKARPAGRVDTRTAARRKPEPVPLAVERPNGAGTGETALARQGAVSAGRHGDHPVSPRSGNPQHPGRDVNR